MSNISMHATLPVGSAPGVGPATPGTPGSTSSTAPPPPPEIVQPVLPETPIPPADPPVVKKKYQRSMNVPWDIGSVLQGRPPECLYPKIQLSSRRLRYRRPVEEGPTWCMGLLAIDPGSREYRRWKEHLLILSEISQKAKKQSRIQPNVLHERQEHQASSKICSGGRDANLIRTGRSS